MKDIVIVGGGPAGAYLGYCLAKNGIRAVIFDHSHPREKPCGGGIPAVALKRFPILNETPGPRGADSRLMVIAPNNRHAVLEDGMPYQINVSRLRLDKFLLDLAVEQGAKHIEEKVTGIEYIDSVWHVKTGERVVETGLIAGADGVNSIVRRYVAGPHRKDDLALCYGLFARGIEDTIPVLKYIKGMKGYIWTFPRGDHTSIGIGGEFNNARLLKQELNKFIAENYPRLEILSRWGALAPSARGPETFSAPCAGEGWLLVGDAAGHVDPVSGEGIRYALWSAELAAGCIAGGNHLYYDKLWRKRYGHYLLNSARLKKYPYYELPLNITVGLARRSKTFSKSALRASYHGLTKKQLALLAAKGMPGVIYEVMLSLRPRL